MTRRIEEWALAAAVLLLLAGAGRGDEASDISLRHEVSRYLEEAPARQEDPMALKATWKEGLRFETADKAFMIKVGGRVQVDAFLKSGDDDLDANYSDGAEDGVRIRRARLYVLGTIYKNVEFSAEFEFATASPELRNVFVGLKKLPVVGNFRMGHFKEPFCLEEATSDNYISFMERPSPNQAFAPAYMYGAMLFNAHFEERLTWAVGLFKDQAKEKEGAQKLEDGAYAVTLRVTGLVVDNKEEALLVHLGAGFSYRDPSGGSRKFEARPSVSTGAKFVSATVVADDISLFCFEVAAAWKALHAQAEFFLSASSAEGGAPEPGYSGWYVQVGYFLTGEHRPYSRASAAWDRVRPKMNFHDGSGGKGAWEVLIRWASIDLNDDGVSGGEMDDLAVGVNWYWNPNTRLMVNFVWGDIDGTAGPGELTVIQWRLQIDF